MLDLHIVPEGWGLYPALWGLSSYGIFVFLGIIFGAAYYFIGMRSNKVDQEHTALIVMAALLGGATGAKLLEMVFKFRIFAEDPLLFVSGRTVLGGLFGGFLGVLLIKYFFRIKGRYGNVIAPAAALGIAFGRVGCLLAGCCYGKAAGGWGLDFGDGVLRYPTQVFEIVFHLAAFIILHFYKKRVQTPGILFRGYVLSYLIFRYFTEFFRENDLLWAGQTFYQLICLGGILFIGFSVFVTKKRGGA